MYTDHPTPRVASRPHSSRVVRWSIAAVVILFQTAIWTAWAATWNPRTGDNKWSNRDNWLDRAVPRDGEDLVFPGGVLSADRSMHNDLPAGRSFRSLTFLSGSYFLEGNSIIVTDAITSSSTSGLSEVELDIQLDGQVTMIIHSGLFILSGVISGNGGGVIKEGASQLAYTGSAANTYTGVTRVRQGTLRLGKSNNQLAIQGSQLIIGDSSDGLDTDAVSYDKASQLSVNVTITINETGLLDLNDLGDDVGVIILNGGRIETGTGILDLRGSVSAAGVRRLAIPTSQFFTATIAGRIDLGISGRTFTVSHNSSFSASRPELLVSAQISGPAPLIKDGSGDMELSGDNSLTGNVEVRSGRLMISHSRALGEPDFGVTTVSGGASLELMNGVAMIQESLVLSGGNPLHLSAPAQLVASGSNPITWLGSIRLDRIFAPFNSAFGADPIVSTASGSTLTLSGAITGTAGLTKLGLGTLNYTGSAANTYTGTTVVNQGVLRLAKTVANGALRGHLVVGDGNGNSESDLVRVEGTAEQIHQLAQVRVESSGLIIFANGKEAFDSISGPPGGVIDITSHLLRLGNVTPPTVAVFDGLIRGAAGSLEKVGLGVLTLGGDNTYDGPTLVSGGTLYINGNQRQSRVTVDPESGLQPATLGGIGRIGDLNVNPLGIVSPGAAPDAPGRLTANSLRLAANAKLLVDLLQPEPGSGYDQLMLTTTVNPSTANTVDDGVLVLANLGPALALGDHFEIVSAAGSSFNSSDTFAGHPQSSDIVEGPFVFRIFYGSDITLNLNGLPASRGSTRLVVGLGEDQWIDVNECNGLIVPIQNTSSARFLDVVGTLTTTTPGVIVAVSTARYGEIPAGQTRDNQTPFQFYTTPSYRCGEPIEFMLTVQPAGVHAFGIRFTLDVTRPPKVFEKDPCLHPPSGLECPFAANGNANFIALKIPSGLCGPIQRIRISSSVVVQQSLENPQPPPNIIVGFTITGPGNLRFTAGSQNIAGFVLDSMQINSPLADLINTPSENLEGDWTLTVANFSGPGTLAFLRPFIITIDTGCCTGTGPCEMCTDVVLSGDVTTSPTTVPFNVAASRTVCGSSVPLIQHCTPVSAPLRFESYMFVNSGPAACITVKLETSCALFSGAILNPEKPTLEGCPQLLGSLGAPEQGTYSFTAPAFSEFLVFVLEQPGASCGEYTLSVSGGNCQAFLLAPNLPDAGNIKLRWPTAFPGYDLERSTDFEHWVPVPIEPKIENGRFTITEPKLGPKQFYRLHKH